MVDTQQLYQRIKELPDTLLEQVSEYVDFLMIKNRIELNPQADLSDEVKAELDQRYQDYLDNPANAIPLKEVKDELMKKYGKA